MGYVEKNLIAGEKVVYKTGLHWIVMVVPTLLAVIFAIVGIWLLVRGASSSDAGDSRGALEIGGVISLLVGVALFVHGWLRRNSIEMAVTNKRIVIKTGIASRRTIEMLLAKVESIDVNEGMFGRMLGYGSVMVRGIGGSPEPFDTIEHPLLFRRQVQQQIENTGK